MQVCTLLQKDNESRILVVFPLNTHYYYYSVHFQCDSCISKRKQIDGDRQSVVKTWGVLGRKHGEVNNSVSLARGSTCHENTGV